MPDDGPRAGAAASLLDFETAVARLPGHLLRRCQQIAVAIFLQECRDLDLTPLQFAMLSALAGRPGLDQASLGGLIALDRTTVAVVAKNLEERGLISRERSAADRRARELLVTPAGRDLLAAAEPAMLQAQERILAPLDETERRLFVALLLRIAEEKNDESRAPFRGIGT